jgi:SAM-dependent methyltransferase
VAVTFLAIVVLAVPEVKVNALTPLRIKVNLALKFCFVRFLTKAGMFLQELPIFVLRPRDLIRFGKENYCRPSALDFWADKNFVDSGLFPGEKELFFELGGERGKLLLLGVGGGREAIVLAKSGFAVTGVDFVKEMVERSIANARERNVQILGEVQEISRLDFAPASFDVIWFSCSLYSSVPGKKRRITMLSRVGKSLTPDGRIVCFFYWNPSIYNGKIRWTAGKALSWITFGNTASERGDILKNNQEFLHAFSREEDIRAEFEEAGFEVLRFVYPESSHNAGALLRKKNS